jgi:hypothetical protein
MIVAACRIAVAHTMRESGIAIRALPELSGLQAAVARPGEQARQGGDCSDQVLGLLPFRFVRRVVEMNAVLMGEEAGEKRGQRRPAHAAGHVAVREAHRLLREAIEVRRFDGRMTHEAEVGERLIVGNDHHDVRRLVATGRRARQQHRGSEPRQGSHQRPTREIHCITSRAAGGLRAPSYQPSSRV